MEKKFKNSVTVLTRSLLIVLFCGLSANTWAQRVTVQERLLRAMTLDNMRLEMIVVQQDSTIADQQTALAAAERKQLKTDTLLTEAIFKQKVLKAQVVNQIRQKGVWISTAQKYKRQRNLCIAGVTVVVVGGTTYAVVKSLRR